MLYLAILLCFVFFAGVAMTVSEGLWNNAIALISVLLGGLFGVFLGVPAGNFAAEQAGKGPANAWYFVFAGMWLVFAVSVMVTRVVAERISRTRMKFIPLVDKIAGPILGLLVAVMFTSFATYTLDRGPIKAGEWKYASIDGFPEQVFKYGRAPFRTIATTFAEADQLDDSFVAR